MKNKWYNNQIFISIIWLLGSSLFTILVLVLVNMPALHEWFVMSNQDSGTIGDAVGGVGTVTVGIVSIIMLWLAFTRQGDSIKIEREKMELEREFNQCIHFRAQLYAIRTSWMSMKITSDGGKEYSMNKYIELLKTDDNLDKEPVCNEILFHFLEVETLLTELSGIREENKYKLLRGAKVFYDTIMSPKYTEIMKFANASIAQKLKICTEKIDNAFKNPLTSCEGQNSCVHS
jgi:hypothetical protein